MNSKSALPYVWMLFGAIAFALMAALANSLGKGRCDWQLVALVRTVVPLVLSGLWAASAGARLVFWRPRILWLRSIAGSISLLCTFFALARLPTSDVLTLTNLFPVWVAVLSWPLLHEAPTPGIWTAVVTSVCGVALIQQPHLADGNFAILAALVSSVTSAVAMIGLHRLHGIDARAIVFHFSAVAMVFCLVALFGFQRPPLLASLPTGSTLAMLLGVGVSATVGQLLLTKAFAAGPPAKVSVVGLTQIVFGMLLDLLLWGRAFSPATLAGMALVIAPTAWVMLHRK